MQNQQAHGTNGQTQEAPTRYKEISTKQANKGRVHKLDDINSNDNTMITPLYGHFNEPESILADPWTKGQKQYLAQWRPTPCRDKHIELHEARGYEVADKVNLDEADKNCLNNVADEVASLVFWTPKWECADDFEHSSSPTQARMAQAYKQAKVSQPALKLAAMTSRQQGIGKTNLDRQGQWR